ncbi:cell division protein Fic [Clostridia bacterium]|nr:cell division protein Fic [Clostridia bacterium]
MEFHRIDRLAATLKLMRPLNEAELKRLQEEFIIENTYNSNAIEGNSLTLRETALILKEGVTIGEKPIKDHLEAIGHRDAFEFILSLADSNASLTEWTVKQIHLLVLMNDFVNKGVYRCVPVIITGALHEPPQPHMVPVLIEQLLAGYERAQKDSSKSIIEASAEFHLRFEEIHPFIDGNGRTGRLILNLELIKAGLLPINIKFADRRKYYDCFDDYCAQGNSSKMLSGLIAEYETEELLKYIAILEQKK